jgi:ABC-type nitrate/sulfonate/bicarbonate transport system substrate-binding protein
MNPASTTLARRLATCAVIATVVATVASACSSGAGNQTASTKDVIKIAVLDDPTRHAALWALENSKVNSGSISVNVSYLSTQSAQVAYQSHQYDVVEASPVAMATAAKRGLVMKILTGGIVDRGATVVYVNAGSSIDSGTQLKGKRIAISSTQGSSSVLLQYVLSKKYAIDSRFTGGEVTYQVAPPDTTPALLKQGRVDAAVELNAPAFQLHQLGGFRVAVNLSQDAQELTGAFPLQTMLVADPATERAKTKALAALVTALRASTDYARAHKDDIASAISTSTRDVRPYLEYWWQTGDLRYGNLTSTDQAGINTAWQMAVAAGQLTAAPTFANVRSSAAPTS